MNFYIDFEATQFTNKIISIGCTSETGATFSTLVKPVNDAKVTKFITDLTGITPEMLETAPTADEAFNALFDWVIENGENSIPQYFCYGDGDFAFITHTVKYMTDVRAISFALSLKAQLTDYSQIAIKQLNLTSISLRKLYILLKEEEVVQHHDALEDAEMLKFVSQNLGVKEIDISTISSISTQAKPVKKKLAPEIFLNWPNGKKWDADTKADETNWKVKYTRSGNTKYFDNFETAALWCLKYAGAAGSPKHDMVIRRTIGNIRRCMLAGTNCYGGAWEENE